MFLALNQHPTVLLLLIYLFILLILFLLPYCCTIHAVKFKETPAHILSMSKHHVITLCYDYPTLPVLGWCIYYSTHFTKLTSSLNRAWQQRKCSMWPQMQAVYLPLQWTSAVHRVALAPLPIPLLSDYILVKYVNCLLSVQGKDCVSVSHLINELFFPN